MNEEIRLNQIPTPGNLQYTGTDFYSCSWVEISKVADEKDHQKRSQSFVDLVLYYSNILNKGLCQCGFTLDTLSTDVFAESCVNKIDIDFKSLRSACPPEIINSTEISGIGVNTLESAIRMVEANLLAIELSLQFETDQRYRELIFLNTLKIMTEESEADFSKSFGDMGEMIRDYYNCGKRIMNFVDKLICVLLKTQACILEYIDTVEMKAFIKKLETSNSFVIREFSKIMIRSIKA